MTGALLVPLAKAKIDEDPLVFLFTEDANRKTNKKKHRRRGKNES